MKYLTLALFILMGLINGHTAHSTPTIAIDSFAVFYFSTIQFVETPLSKINGSIPLSKKEAMSRNHYRFTYNEKHQLASVAFYNGTTPREPNHTANLFTLSHRMEFTYGKGFETVVFYDKNNVQIPVLGNCYSFRYTHNDLGFRGKLYFLDQSEKRIVNSWGIYEYQWYYQSNGSVIETRFDDASNLMTIRPGFEFHRLRLYFNHLGHIALMQNIDAEGKLVENESGASQDRITTNAEGNFVAWTVLNNENELERGNGPDIAIGLQGFDEYGYESSLEHRDENNEPIVNHYGICKSKTHFDHFGNIRERRFYDSENRPSVHQIAGYHKLIIDWDKTGNLRKSLRYFDLENEPCSHQTRGYHTAQYKYDEQNRLIRISYHAINGELVNRLDNGIAYITMSYYANGLRKDTSNFDKAGNAL